MRSIQEIIQKKPYLAWILFFATVIIVFFIGILSSSILERKNEAFYTLQLLKPLPEWEPRNEIWGESFPREFESYLKTLDTSFRSKYAGSKWIDYLVKNPELPILWAGYAFSKDYAQARGHTYAITDIRNTLRTGGNSISPQPATCWTCKSPDVPRLISKMGVDSFSHMKWKDLGSEVVNPIGCQDCHDTKTLALKVTRPALVDAFKRQGKEINTFSRQEMRSLVCAQCHVEYYFKNKYQLMFPWDKGFSVDSMETYYDNIQFSDWTHQLSKAPMLKAQHPDYELFRTGVHYDRNVSCVDCHMPYKSEGGVKYTDHQIQSPLNAISTSCQVCHREETQRLLEDVYKRQDKIEELNKIAIKLLATVHLEAKIAWDNGATEVEMQPVLKLIRHAQWRWDWVSASNGMGFHSPNEALRILATAIDKSHEARRLLTIILMNHNVKNPPILPDITTKEKSQKVIGLEMDKFKKEKEEFINTTVKEWDKTALKRQGTLYIY